MAQILKNGNLIITPKKGTDVSISSTSREIAALHYFTQDEGPQEVPEIRIEPAQTFSRGNFGILPLRLDERPRIFGMQSMPIVLGFYEEMMGGRSREPPEGFNPFNF